MVDLFSHTCGIKRRPMFMFGVIADAHYADVDDGWNHMRTRKRCYRRSLSLVKTAVSDWLSKPVGVSFVLQLGDLIDGKNAVRHSSETAATVTCSELVRTGVPVYHAWGNHDLYCFSRSDLLKSSMLNSSLAKTVSTPVRGSTGYYHFSPVNGFRFVVLDQYEVSMLGYDEDSDCYR